MHFTWYTYAAAIARAEARFSIAFREQVHTDELFRPDSAINRRHATLQNLRKRVQREEPKTPARVIRDIFHVRAEKKFH